MKSLFIVFCVFFSCLAHSYEVVGIGTPCVDLTYFVDDDFLASTHLNKGDSQCTFNWESFSSILEKGNSLGSFEGRATGGSSSNTVKGLSRLENSTALLGKLGSDPSGLFYRDVAEKFNIHLLGHPSEEPTMQIAVFVTGDHQRTFFAYLGSGWQISQETLSLDLFQNVRLVHFDGYTLDEYSVGFVEKAMLLAKEAGASVSFDLGCCRVVNKYRDEIFHLLHNYIDVVFGNESEVEVLLGKPACESCSLLSSHCSVAVTLLGPNGACISSQGKSFFSPAIDIEVVDTTGAGDLFAAGFLHGYLQGYSLEECASIGNLLGGTIVSVVGAEIPDNAWPSIRQKIQETIRKDDTFFAGSPVR